MNFPIGAEQNHKELKLNWTFCSRREFNTMRCNSPNADVTVLTPVFHKLISLFNGCSVYPGNMQDPQLQQALEFAYKRDHLQLPYRVMFFHK